MDIRFSELQRPIQQAWYRHDIPEPIRQRAQDYIWSKFREQQAQHEHTDFHLDRIVLIEVEAPEGFDLAYQPLNTEDNTYHRVCTVIVDDIEVRGL